MTDAAHSSSQPGGRTARDSSLSNTGPQYSRPTRPGLQVSPDIGLSTNPRSTRAPVVNQPSNTQPAPSPRKGSHPAKRVAPAFQHRENSRGPPLLLDDESDARERTARVRKADARHTQLPKSNVAMEGDSSGKRCPDENTHPDLDPERNTSSDSGPGGKDTSPAGDTETQPSPRHGSEDEPPKPKRRRKVNHG